MLVNLNTFSIELVPLGLDALTNSIVLWRISNSAKLNTSLTSVPRNDPATALWISQILGHSKWIAPFLALCPFKGNSHFHPKQNMSNHPYSYLSVFYPQEARADFTAPALLAPWLNMTLFVLVSVQNQFQVPVSVRPAKLVRDDVLHHSRDNKKTMMPPHCSSLFYWDSLSSRHCLLGQRDRGGFSV